MSYDQLDSILKSRDITLPTKVCLVKAMVFPVVMYGCESWTTEKAECQGIDGFELWCWTKLLRVPWTARRSNQSILKEISPDYSLERLMLKLKLQWYFSWQSWFQFVLLPAQFLMMYSAYKLNKQGDNIQPWHTPFPIWNQSVVPCPVLTVASSTAYKFLKRQVRWSGIPISFRIFHSLLWSTQSKALA